MTTKPNNRTLGPLPAIITIGRTSARRQRAGNRANGGAPSPHWGPDVLAARRPGTTNYGCEAAAPVTSYHSLERLLPTAKRSSLAPGSPRPPRDFKRISNAVELVDHARYANTSLPASVAVGLHPLPEAGAGSYLGNDHQGHLNMTPRAGTEGSLWGNGLLPDFNNT